LQPVSISKVYLHFTSLFSELRKDALHVAAVSDSTVIPFILITGAFERTPLFLAIQEKSSSSGFSSAAFSAMERYFGVCPSAW